MESLKKVISLNQAAKISGYTSDYLGFLIRKGDIKGQKKGRAWFTTEEEINNYLFKKKIRRNEFAIKDFFSSRRSRNIFWATIIVFVGGFLMLSNFIKSSDESLNEIHSAITSDGESIKIINN